MLNAGSAHARPALYHYTITLPNQETVKIRYGHLKFFSLKMATFVCSVLFILLR